MIRIPFISCFVFVGIAACSSHDPVDAQAKSAVDLPNVNAPAPTAIGEPHGPTTPSRLDSASTARIPAALEGRWALAPRDCTSGGSAAKGLLVVTPKDLRFSESHAVPSTDVAADDKSIGGNFAFTGDGRSRTKYEALTSNGQRLTRTEINPTASFTYAKCS
jgi:hypothetical protein